MNMPKIPKDFKDYVSHWTMTPKFLRIAGYLSILSFILNPICWIAFISFITNSGRMILFYSIDFSIVLGFALCFFKYFEHDYQIKKASDNHMLNVVVNNVDAGQISEKDYENILKKNFENESLYFQQMMSIGKTLKNFFFNFLWSVPFIAFWGLVIIGLSDSQSIDTFKHTLETASSSDIHHFVTSSFECFTVFYTMTALVMAFLSPKKYGFQNKFEDQISIEVRKALKICAEGDVYITRKIIFEPDQATL
jgi:hypothetical protein